MSRASNLAGFTTSISAEGADLNVGIVTAISIISKDKYSFQSVQGTQAEFSELLITGVSTFVGDVSIGGTLTYEDVTNVDSVGIITAQIAIFVGPKSGIGVTLNGVTGKITTKGNIVSSSSTTEFADLEPAGVLKLESDNPLMVNEEALQIRYDGVQKTKLSYNGNATFTGIVTTNNGIEVGPSSGIGITLNANGNASFADASAHTYLARTTNDTFGTFIARNLAGNNTVTIYQNGNTSFAGVGSFGGLISTPGSVKVGDQTSYYGNLYANGQLWLKSQTSQIGDTTSWFKCTRGSGDVFQVTGNGTTRIGGTIPASPNIELNADGSAIYEGTIISTYSPTNGGYGFLLANPSNTAQTAGGLYQKDGGASSLYLKSVWNGATTIDLEGDGGTITAAGSISCTNSGVAYALNSVTLNADGYVYAKRDAGDGTNVWVGSNNAGDTSTIDSNGNLDLSGSITAAGSIASDRPTGNACFVTKEAGVTKTILLAEGDLRLGGSNPNSSTATNIRLNGTDGSVTATGTASFVDGDFTVSANGNLEIYRQTSSSSNAIRLYSDFGSTKAQVLTIKTDGSIDAAGGVQSAKYLYSTITSAVSNPLNYNAVLVDYLGTQTAQIKADGSAIFNGRITGGDGTEDQYGLTVYNKSVPSSTIFARNFENTGVLFQGYDASNLTCSIAADGSATFNGNVSTIGFNITNVTGNIGGTGGSGSNDIYIGNGSSNKYLRVITGGTGTGNVNITGSFTAAGNVTAYSDITLKKNIEVIPNALDKVLEIRGVTFDRTDKECARQSGVIAQEVEKVLPEVVDTNEDGIKSVAYGNIVGLLIEAIKEQQVQIDELKAKLEVK